MKSLSSEMLTAENREVLEAVKAAPVTILQIGEGNFLRGFADWMIHTCRSCGLFAGSIAVTQPRPAGKGQIEKLASQDGLYTLVTQGLEDGSPIKRIETIQVFSQVFDPYSEWSRLIDLAISEDLRIIISNTTEAGLVYNPEELTEKEPILSYPGKIAYLLYERYKAFQGAHNRGLIMIPCELVERNGDVLKSAVLRYAQDWHLPTAFQEWVKDHNRFLNSLVDRIVTGYPDNTQAEAYFAELGYKDAMLCTTEPYHLWAIEAEPEMEEILPFRKAGLNVHWTNDLTSFQLQKVRILNGAHTWMALIGTLHGVEHVRELLEHPQLGEMVQSLVLNEILPTLPYEESQLKEYAKNVFDRFGNPFIRHRLADIAMNTISKFKVRLLPTFTHYNALDEQVPSRLVLGLAALIRLYQVTKMEHGVYEGLTLSGEIYVVRDDEKVLDRFAEYWNGRSEGISLYEIINEILSDEVLWGEDLSVWSGLVENVKEQFEYLERGGVYE
ncbi:tagaturonate reductase [Paenibacillus sp. FSL H7-0714]|uniref:tagaturonate reductase n=1 Tax=Paenibacillus sp. FSL H7-0714 TaxID=2954735 RepID=UPI0030F62C23